MPALAQTCAIPFPYCWVGFASSGVDEIEISFNVPPSFLPHVYDFSSIRTEHTQTVHSHVVVHGLDADHLSVFLVLATSTYVPVRDSLHPHSHAASRHKHTQSLTHSHTPTVRSHIAMWALLTVRPYSSTLKRFIRISCFIPLPRSLTYAQCRQTQTHTHTHSLTHSDTDKHCSARVLHLIE